jgi:RimJ/RimL family protein N-acetyltransferase
MTALYTARLELVPMTLAHIEAVLGRRHRDLGELLGARVPAAWPGREALDRVLHKIASIRASPEDRLWGDRALLTREEPRRLVGSVVFNGAPDASGLVEIAYGIEPASRRCGYAVEAVRACVSWALEQPGVRAVGAVTMPFHQASIRVLERVGLRRVDVREHEMLGELYVYELRRADAAAVLGAAPVAQPRPPR